MVLPCPGLLCGGGAEGLPPLSVSAEELGAPTLVVLPMVGNSKLALCMLCRLVLMLHSHNLFENEKHMHIEFTSCKINHVYDNIFRSGTFASKGCIICLELITGLAITRGKKLLKLNALRSSQMLMRKMQNLPICTINYIFGKYGKHKYINLLDIVFVLPGIFDMLAVRI